MEDLASRTFSLDVSSPGAASLRHAVMLKLSEFMGNYTDDVLAEYVVVLVGHGKQRAQAVKDLEAFLGERSEAFVIWLWDHLCSNMHLYSSAPEASSPMEGFDGRDQAAQVRSKEAVKSIQAEEQSEVKNRVQVSSVTHEHGRTVRLRKDSDKDVDLKSRNDPDMGASFFGRGKTLPFSGDFRIAANEFNGGRTATHSAKRPRSPESWIHRERNATDESHRHKRLLSPPRVIATRRLLQSAVREAVAPATGQLKRLESSLKRLRSVVSADAENSESIADASSQQPLRATARSHAVRHSKMAVPAMVVAMKAAAAAAEDAIKVRGRLTGNVWDRLGKQSAEVVDSKEEEVHEHVGDVHEDREILESRFVGATQHISEKKARKRARLGSNDRPSKGSTEDDAAAVSDPTIDEYREGQSSSGRSVYAVRGGKYQTDEVNDESFARAHNNKGQRSRAKDRVDQSREESVTVQYRLAQNMEGDAKETHKQKGLNSSSGLANSSQKIVNISVNVNTWKPRPYETLKDTTASDQPIVALTARKSQDQVDEAEDTDMLGVHDTNEPKEQSDSDKHVTDIKNRTGQVQLEMNKLLARQTEVTKEVQKETSPTVTGTKQFQKSQDDTESRTVFVANIHFAATKETVMAHFVQCGDIERIVMLTDGATGLPKGSAYIEFNSKDAVDKALALNESSFYSRPLKVVRKEAAIQAMQETTPLLVRPTFIRRPIPLSLRVPFRGRILRGAPYLVHRFPAMPRPYGNFPNLQWKRDGVAAGGSMNPTALSGNRPGYGLPIRPARSLSYVRSSNNPPAQNTAATEESKVFSQQGEDDGTKPDLGMCPAQEQKGDMETSQVELEQVGAGD